MNGAAAVVVEMRQGLGVFAIDQQGQVLAALSVMGDGDSPGAGIPGQGPGEIGGGAEGRQRGSTDTMGCRWL